MPTVLHLIPYLGRAQGGPVVSLAAYADGLVQCDWGCVVASVSRPADGPTPSFPAVAEVHRLSGSRFGSFRYSPAMSRLLRTLEFDIVHSHCLWTDVNRLADRMARERGVPHILAPCGHLQPGALRRSWWKKWPVKRWFQDRAIAAAHCLHAKSETEYNGLRAFGLRNPVAIVANPVALPPPERPPDPLDFRDRHGIAPSARCVLFLGRIHPVKGVERLIRAWKRVHARHPDWRLVLAGPDEGGYRAEVERLIASLGLASSVVFPGPLDDMAKWDAFAAAELFVMPSDFENFGLSIAEAMMAGLPVVTTTGTPWATLPVREAGWWVEATPEALAHALDEALSLAPERRRAMGERAREMAVDFQPTTLARRLISAYRYNLGTGPVPDCVRLD